MAKPYDAGVRVLIEQYLPDWLALAPYQAQGPIRVIDSDLSTITATADKVLYIEGPQPWILHLEPQANWDGDLEKRVSWYNELLSYKHDCLVHSIIVLLRREADSPRLTGEHRRQFSSDSPYRYFRYQVLRVWQMSAEVLAKGGWGLFPLAPLCDDAQQMLPALIAGMAKRLQEEIIDSQQMSVLWEATAILSNMRFEPETIMPIMQRYMTMIKLEDLKSYNYMVAKGIRATILRLGGKKFGEPDGTTVSTIESTKDLDQLGKLSDRLLDVSSWQELLADEVPPHSSN